MTTAILELVDPIKISSLMHIAAKMQIQLVLCSLIKMYRIA